jgi:AcrR family transcriptional regulator
MAAFPSRADGLEQAGRKPSSRTLATRARIIATAEQLFAERSVASVSLNEITRAAGQKNRNAVHYHFGSKQALVEAIFRKHWQHIAALRNEMLEALSREQDPPLAAVVRALVLPVAARFEDPDGGLAYIRISAELAASSLLEVYQRGATADAEPAWGSNLTPYWAPFLKALPERLRSQRMSLVVGMLFHGLADHAVYRERGDLNLGDTELMLSNLVDSICAVVQAPVSEATLDALERSPVTN